MGSVAITYRVMPEGDDVDLGALKDAVRTALGTAFRSMEEKPVAFGLKAIHALAVVDDAGGGSDRLEASLQTLPGVGSVQAIDVTLV